jgi:hypothetical protein
MAETVEQSYQKASSDIHDENAERRGFPGAAGKQPSDPPAQNSTESAARGDKENLHAAHRVRETSVCKQVHREGPGKRAPAQVKPLYLAFPLLKMLS